MEEVAVHGIVVLLPRHLTVTPFLTMAAYAAVCVDVVRGAVARGTVVHGTIAAARAGAANARSGAATTTRDAPQRGEVDGAGQ